MDSAFKVDLLERTYAQPVRTGGPSTIHARHQPHQGSTRASTKI